MLALTEHFPLTFSKGPGSQIKLMLKSNYMLVLRSLVSPQLILFLHWLTDFFSGQYFDPSVISIVIVYDWTGHFPLTTWFTVTKRLQLGSCDPYFTK